MVLSKRVGATDRTVGVRAEKAYEKYAWILPFVFGLFLLIIDGPALMTYGYQAECGCTMPSSTPSVAINHLNSQAQEIGFFAAYTGVLIAAIAWTGFRRGQKWSWYFMLSALAFTLGVDLLAGIQTGIPIAGPGGVLGVVLSVPALLLPYRKFFPRKQP